MANTLPLCILAFRQSVEPLINRSITDKEIIATFGPSEEGTIMALAPAHYDKGIAAYLRCYESLHEICPAMFDGIEPLLAGLQNKSVGMAMVTGKGKRSTAISLKQFNATHFFDIIETGSAAGPRKAAGIQAVLDKWEKVNKEEIIYVGDAPGDIEASRKVGVPVIAAAWAETAEPEKLSDMNPDELFFTVNEFADWLNKRV
jgi:phosphoglycolate phosphatase/pyrophosphatase PpaX